MFSCQLCDNYGAYNQEPNIYFCVTCRTRINNHYFSPQKIWTQASMATISVASLLPYEGWFREICLAAKVHGNTTALGILVDLFIKAPMAQQIVASHDVICPVPSSLWSRIRGRYDIANQLAQCLATKFNKPLVLLPRSQYMWRWHKRAKAPKVELSSDQIDKLSKKIMKLESLPGPSVLLIDDIITTGLSLMETSCKISCGRRSYLTLFGAFRS